MRARPDGPNARWHAPEERRAWRDVAKLIALVVFLASGGTRPMSTLADQLPVVETIHRIQPKIVKVHGAGGVRGLESYQSGFLISAEGFVLTSFSHVLDTDDLRVVLSDGRRMEAELLGADPRLGIAVLDLDAEELDHFKLAEAIDPPAGTRVLALSNLFGVATGDEPASVQHGVISIRADLNARRGIFPTPYRGPVYVLDAVVNNPGAAGGALVTRRGELIGMLGKELRDAKTNLWLNYALPIDQIQPSVTKILGGEFVVASDDIEQRLPDRPITLRRLGLRLVPNIVPRTPPYIDQVAPGTPADIAGLRPDDLIVLVDERLIPSITALDDELRRIDYEDPISLFILRGVELLQVTVQP